MRARDITLIALLLAVTGILSLISIPCPFTGAGDGANPGRYAGGDVVLRAGGGLLAYLLLGAAGAPVFAGGSAASALSPVLQEVTCWLCPGGDDHCPAAGSQAAPAGGGADSRVALHLRSGHRWPARLPAWHPDRPGPGGIALPARRSFQGPITIAVAAA